MAKEIDLSKLTSEAEAKAAAKVRDVDMSRIEMPPPAAANENVHPLWEGIKQGATFGFSDEAMAALKSALGDRTYREEWQDLQKEIEAAKAANPERFMAGEIGGGLASFLIPGTGLVGNAFRGAKLAKSAGLAAKLANAAKVGAINGAIQGAVTGVGTGGELGVNSIGDALMGGAGGALGGTLFAPAGVAAGEIAPKVINVAKEKIVQPVLKSQAAAVLAKIPTDTAKEVIENLPAYSRKKAQTTKEVGKEFLEKVNKFSSDLDSSREAARASLSPDAKVISAKEAGKILENALLESKALFKNKKTVKIAPEDGAAGPTMIKKTSRTDAEKPSVLNLVQKQKQQLRSLADEKGMVSETDLRGFLDGLKQHTKFTPTNPDGSKNLSSGYNKAYGRLNQKLRDGNRLYDEAMEPVRANTDQVSKLAKAFGLKKTGYSTDDDAGRYVLTKTALNKFKNLRNDDLAADQLKTFSNLFPDTDLGAMANRVKNEKALEMKRPSFGTMIGALMNPKAGFGLGLLRDTMGPPLWRAAAVGSDPMRTAAPEAFEALVRRPMINLFATPFDEENPQK